MDSILLDTHAFIWLVEDDANLPVSLRNLIENTNNVFVSIASFWEISIKIQIGKLTLQSNFNDMESSFESTRFKLLPISLKDTIQVSNLPLYHRDPFDRILVAQAMNHSLAIVSRDVAFDAYAIQRVWA
jgi:PIN domain nuclease of toxin-antitoxin system